MLCSFMVWINGIAIKNSFMEGEVTVPIHIS